MVLNATERRDTTITEGEAFSVCFNRTGSVERNITFNLETSPGLNIPNYLEAGVCKSGVIKFQTSFKLSLPID